MGRVQWRRLRSSDARRRTLSSKSECKPSHRIDAPFLDMTPRLRTPALAFLAAFPLATATADELGELKAMVRAMQKTIADQNERIASLEKRQTTAPKDKSTAKTKSDRSLTVAGTNVPIAELPAGALPKATTP